MVNEINYITRVEVSGLWGRYDIVWNLNSDVNVFAGINGSGKSTILNCIYGVISKGEVPDLYQGLIKKIKFFCNNMELLSYYYVADENDKDVNEAIYTNEKSNFHCVQLSTNAKNNMLPNYFSSVSFKENKNIFQDSTKTVNELNKIFHANIINTFDNELTPLEAVQKLSDEQVKTELDFEIYQLQIKYMDYQLNLGRKKDAIFKDNQSNPFIDNVVIEFKKLSYSQERLLEIIDELFSETGKRVNRDKNQLVFLLSDNKEINAYQLSSGEKQLLIILLTALIQDNKPSILLMDEPEISLHIDWQRKLIKYIRELNPNVQVILATHSPDIIIDGWMDKVFNVSDIIVKDNAAL
jgi:predicted ATP-dependent endonuclease of OLD family